MTMNEEEQMRYTKLRQLQSLNLDSKISLAKQRIRQFAEEMGGNVIVSFSGGADSTVLLHITRQVIRDVKAVFVNTGLEHSEIVRFVRHVENVDIIKPKMSFRQVLDKYGYPVISKDVSCAINEIRNTKSDYLRNVRLHGSERGVAGKLPEKYRFLLDAPFKISDRCCHMIKKQPLKDYEKNMVYFRLLALWLMKAEKD